MSGMKKRSKPFLGPLLAKLAPSIGATVTIEPVWGIVGQIAFKNGRKRYFRYNSLDLNTLGASEVAKDKDYANFFLASAGYPIVPGKAFYSREWSEAIEVPHDPEAAYAFAKELGFPVVVKPNSGSQGSGVNVAHTKRDLTRALRTVFTQDRVALIQKLVAGRDYRIVVLDGEVISAYERIPLNVTGDGKSSIRTLLEKKQAAFQKSGRDTRIVVDDEHILRKLARTGYSLASIPAAGVRVSLRDNANLSTGGDSIDVTLTLHPEFRRLAASITNDMGLRFCGVDLMVEGTLADVPSTYWVLEVNSAPGLDHYVRTGSAQEKIVEDLYRKVLLSMEIA